MRSKKKVLRNKCELDDIDERGRIELGVENCTG